MIDFGRWFSGQSVPAPPPVEEELPDGVDEMKDGTFGLRCCSCGRSFIANWFTREEAMQLDPDQQYCYGSDRCLP